jgi:ADP-ribosylglycohydrolase
MNDPFALTRARRSLTGIAIGDAFGESFFGEEKAVLAAIDGRYVPQSTWEFTDDTVMALAVYEELETDGNIDQDRLAQKFARNYALDNRRGYGGTAHKILREIGEGQPWRSVAMCVFDGMGSMGNGASMRVGPIGAYFAQHGDAARLMACAEASAGVTHTHAEGIAGAVAVALATAIATQTRLQSTSIAPAELILQVAAAMPESDTKYKVAKAATLKRETHLETLKVILGNGSQIIATDTVPFAIWCAAHYLLDFEEALWRAVAILGDRDTICAIVGGIVIMGCEPSTVPSRWVDAVEDLESSMFRSKI